jgi:uncharacterized OB-fold protein
MEKEKECVCPDCGELLGADTRFCPSCGSAKKRVFVVARDTVQAFGGIIEEANDQLRKIERKLATGMRRRR